MRQTPCESMIWNGLPVIRKEIAGCMINDFGLSQKEAAEKLGVTPAAVCQYVSRKRGKVEIYDDGIIGEIKISTKKIIDSNDGTKVTSETCRICKLMRSNGMFNIIEKVSD